MVQIKGLGQDLLGGTRPRQNTGTESILTRIGVATVNVHVRIQNVVDSAGYLVISRRAGQNLDQVFGESWGIGRRDVGCGQEVCDGWIDALGWNPHIGEFDVRFGIGIETASRKRVIGVEKGVAVSIGYVGHEDGDTVIGKITTMNFFGRYGGRAGGVRTIPEPLVAPKIEGFVSENLSSGGRAKLVAAKRRFGSVRAPKNVVEVILGIQGVVTEEIISGAMKAVGARLGGGIDLGSSSPELRRVRVGLDLEFLNFVDRRNSGKGIEIRLGVGGPV